MRRGEQRVIELVSCLLVHLRQNVCVGVERYTHICVAQAVLYNLSIDASSNHGGRIAVVKIVQTDGRKLVLGYESLPLLGQRIGMEGLTIFLEEHIAKVFEGRIAADGFIID